MKTQKSVRLVATLLLAGIGITSMAQSVAGIAVPGEVATELQVSVTPESNLKMKVAFANASQERSIVIIKDAKGEELYHEIVWGNFYKKLDFGQLPDGSYTIEVSKGKASFSKSIAIETNRQAVLAKL